MIYPNLRNCIGPTNHVDPPWTRLPPHPGQAIKPMTGRQKGSPVIHTLTTYDDTHVFIGHGDWDANDGSTMLVSLDPTTQSYTNHGVYTTEAFDRFKVIDNVLYAPYVDSTGYWGEDYPYVEFDGTTTHLPSKVGAIHIFDVAKYQDTLWVAGSAIKEDSGTSMAWATKDSGKTWKAYEVDGVKGDWERAKRIIPSKDGKLYLQLLGRWVYFENDKWLPADQPQDAASLDPLPINPPPYANKFNPSAYTKTSTHHIVGTTKGDIYIRPR